MKNEPGTTVHYPRLDEPEEYLVRIPAGEVTLEGNLHLTPDAGGIVVFAHGSGSSRHSPRNRFVARHLQEVGLATLLFDLLTSDEEFAERATGHLRFDIKLLARRLAQVTDWLRQQPQTRALKTGYFGASTGAAAALVAAAEHPRGVSAIVSRGGRPDLAGAALARVKAPTLLLVGGEDAVVIDLNKEAFEQLQVEKKLQIIPGATHLFEEPGALEEVADLARQWFEHHLAPAWRS
ncbi:MAG: alpha/beta fold hydrolase [Gammaproteobacteria bacterium]|nr:MAG: alpha/beta fold hydrolase [Gammaproteobacteria bacterium]